MALENWKVKDLVDENPNFQLVYAKESQTVAEVMEILNTNRILSTPVLSETEDGFLGIIDMLDLVTYCTAKFSAVSLLASESYQQMKEFSSTKVGNLMDISGRNQWACIAHTSSAFDAVNLLAKKNSHRVFVTNEVNDVVGLITQSSLMDSLFRRKEQFTNLFSEKVKVNKTAVVSIQTQEFVIEGLKKMWNTEVSGVAVVDANGKLVGNLSATDLLKVRVKPVGELINDLYQPCKQFLHIRESTEDSVMMQEFPKQEPIVVNESTTLEEAMATLLKHKVHRAYAVDDQFRPIGVVALGDILQHFASGQSQ